MLVKLAFYFYGGTQGHSSLAIKRKHKSGQGLKTFQIELVSEEDEGLEL